MEGGQTFAQGNFANGKAQYADWQQMGIIKKTGSSGASSTNATQGINNRPQNANKGKRFWNN